MTPFQTQRMAELQNLLQFEPPMSIYRNLIDTLGSVKCALLLSQYLFITKVRASKADKDIVWIHRTSQQMLDETALTSSEYKRARAQLIEIGVLVKQTRVCEITGSPEIWVSIDFKRLSYLVAQSLGIDVVEALTIDDLILNSQRLKAYLRYPLPYRKVFARISGGVNAGLMMSCLLRSLERGHDEIVKGYVSKSISDWSEQIGIGWSAQKHCRNTLSTIGLIKERHLWRTRTIFTEIEFDTIIAKITEHIECTKQVQISANQKGTLIKLKRDFDGSKKGLYGWSKTVNTDGALPRIQLEQNHEYGIAESEDMDGANPQILKKLDLNALKPQPQDYEPQLESTEKIGNKSVDGIVSGGFSRNDNSLFWPTSLLEIEKESINCLFIKNKVNSTNAQLILDEMSGRLSMHRSVIDNKVGYIRGLINRHVNGQFVPELAIKVQKNRAYQVETKKKQDAEKVQRHEAGNVPDKPQHDRHEYLKQLLRSGANAVRTKTDHSL